MPSPNKVPVRHWWNARPRLEVHARLSDVTESRLAVVAKYRMPGWGAADRALPRLGAAPAQWVAVVVKGQVVVVLVVVRAGVAQVATLAAQSTCS